jgi:hypothetical protein
MESSFAKSAVAESAVHGDGCHRGFVHSAINHYDSGKISVTSAGGECMELGRR